jgi:ribonuclease P protein subunit POP4
MRTVRNILRHELIGLYCEIVSSKNKSNVGLKGKIIDETIKTIVIDGKRIPKQNTIFRIKLNDIKIDVDGNYLLSRPEDRIKKKIRKW